MRAGRILLTDIEVGKRDLTAVDIPLGSKSATVTTAHESWPYPGKTTEIIKVRVSIALDGVNYRFFAGFGTTGETLVDRLGNDITDSSIKFELPEPNNPNRRGRVIINVRMRLRTTLDVDIT